jgi:predicted negative regulator of RcsB-dependent stress response
MRLRRPLCSALAALLAAAPVAAEQAHAPAIQGGVAISVGQAADLSHIEFKGGGVSVKRDGEKLIVSFSGAVKGPDLSRLKVNPPRFLKSTETATTGGRPTLTLTLAENADAKTGVSDGATFINLYQKPEPPPAPPIETPAGPARPDPVPASGVVVAQATKAGPQVALAFPWKAAMGAAVFRRGDAIWAVFDAKARLDVQTAAHAMPQYPMRVVDGPDWVALRIAAPADVPFSAAGVGPNWTLIIGPGAQARSLQIAMARAEEDGPATLAANVAGATRVIWLDDPSVGDKLAVVTALAPAKGLILRREYVDLAALPSAHGLALEPSSDNLNIATDGDVVRVTKVGGLALSSPVRTRMSADVELPQAAIMPGLINFGQWSKYGEKGFLERYDGLMNAAAAETNRQVLGDKSAGLAARVGLARFLTGSELGFEAIGMLNTLVRSHPEMLANAEFRGLRGAAKVIAGRPAEALVDFSAPQLADDPASALWRGYADTRLGHWTEARQEFQAGAKALHLFNAAWRTRFARANAEASLRLNDFVTATQQIKYAIAQTPPEALEQLATYLTLARLLEAEGLGDKALPIYDAVARARAEQLSTPAILHAAQLRLYSGKLSPDKAAATFASLRYRWRGDATELEVVRALGQLYLVQGRYREALDAWRTARQRRSDLPEALQISEDLTGAFRRLFLDGEADGLEPIQAVGLFYDFRELTPIGADGDEMVRKLAQRLVNVDLLDQASQLLKYQADSRLDGVPRAIVATDLAVIQLMARHPEEAVNALNSSRNTLLPSALQQQRRLVEARAWLQLNQLDHADEILGADASAEGVSLRAEIAWKRRSWPLAGKVFEQSLGDRWKLQDGQLQPEEESKLLRAATAYSLAQDDAALARLRDRYNPFVDRSRWPEALKVALSGVNVEQITSSNFAQAISDDQAFAGWTTKMRQRFRERFLGGPTPPPTLRPLTTALQETAAPAGEVAEKPEPKGKGKGGRTAAKAGPARAA